MSKLFDMSLPEDSKDRDLTQIGSKKDVKRLPMSLKVFDFPRMHDFDNETAVKLLEALSETDEMSIFDCAYVQALLEFQWPITKKNIIIRQFVPYIVLLLTFFVYTVFHFEDEQSYIQEHLKTNAYFRL